MSFGGFLEKLLRDEIERRAELGEQVPRGMLKRFLLARAKRVLTPAKPEWEVPEPVAGASPESGTMTFARRDRG